MSAPANAAPRVPVDVPKAVVGVVGGGVVVAALAALFIKRNKTGLFGVRDATAKERPVMRRYATQIEDRYDVRLLPRELEIQVYTEIVKTATLGAFCSLVDNVKNAEILGHPIVLLNKIDWEHQAPTPEVEATEVERFVTSVLNEDGGGDGSRRTGVGLLPRQAEVEIYRNALITAVYITEDTLKSLRLRLFDTEYSLEIGPTLNGWQNNKVHPKMTDDELRRLVREELKAPLPTRLLPGVEANIGRVAVALAGEVVGSTEFVFLGHTLRLSLAPPTRQQGGRTGAASDQSSHDTGVSSPFSSLGSSSTSSKETVEIIGEYIDAYMDSRPKGSQISNPFFFSKSLERQTYISFLSNLFGNVQDAVLCQFMGFDVVLNVGPAAKKGANGKLKVPRLEGFAAESSRAAIAEFVDWLLLDPMYNVRAVPDGVERAVYINCFELLTNLLAGALSTFEVDLMGRNVKVRLSEAQERRNLRTVSRFRPKPEVLRQFSRQLSSVEAVQEVMCQVYAFVLAFAAFELSNIKMSIVGRQLGFRLTQPVSDVLSPEDLEAAMEGELSKKFSLALNTLVEEMLAAAEDDGPDPKPGAGDALRGVLARRRGEGSGDGLGGSSGQTLAGEGSGGGSGGVNDPAGNDVLHRSGGGGVGSGGGKGGVVNRGGEIDTDSAIYRTFIAHHRPACDVFPFPYLTPDGFSGAVSDLVAELQPKPAAGVKKKQGAQSGAGSRVRALPAVQMLSAAVDVNGDGVIAWGEYYFAAKEIASVFVSAT